MNITRSAALWSLVFLAAGFYLGSTQPVFAQSQPGWGEIWQQRMTIGQAQLDDAFKLAESGRVNEALAVIDQVIDGERFVNSSGFRKFERVIQLRLADRHPLLPNFTPSRLTLRKYRLCTTKVETCGEKN